MPLPIEIDFDPQDFAGFWASAELNHFQVRCKPVVAVKAVAKVIEKAANIAATHYMGRGLRKLRCDQLCIPEPDRKAWIFDIRVSLHDGNRVVVVAMANMADGSDAAYWEGSATYRPLPENR